MGVKCRLKSEDGNKRQMIKEEPNSKLRLKWLGYNEHFKINCTKNDTDKTMS